MTNEKYRAFIEAGGYDNLRHWSEDGWKWRVANRIIGPAYWNDTKLNIADRPVVGVNYYEAEAYAKWAGNRPLPSRNGKRPRGVRTDVTIHGARSLIGIDVIVKNLT